MNYAKTFTRYKAWANKVFFSVLHELPEHELTAPRPIIFGNLLRTLNHSCAMDYVWQCHLLGKPHGLTTRNPENPPPLAELDFRQREIDQWYIGYADALTAQQLEEVVEFEFIGGGAGAMKRSDILLHVVNHGTYHRGHAADILYHLDIAPPSTDLPVFLREQAKAGQTLR